MIISELLLDSSPGGYILGGDKRMEHSSEIISVVDSSDQELTTISREQEIPHGYFVRVIDLFIIDDKGHLLLQRRSQFKKTAPSKWTHSVGGFVKHNESYLDCAVRETYEELGLSLAKEQLLFIDKTTRISGDIPQMAMILQATLKERPTVCFSDREVRRIKWMTIQKLQKCIGRAPQLFSRTFMKTLASYKSKMY